MELFYKIISTKEIKISTNFEKLSPNNFKRKMNRRTQFYRTVVNPQFLHQLQYI